MPRLLTIILVVVCVIGIIYGVVFSMQRVSSDVGDINSPLVMIIDTGGIIGSGTLIDRDTVLTGHHFLKPNKRYGVSFGPGDIEWGVLRVAHPSRDIALLDLENPRKGPYGRVARMTPHIHDPVIAYGTSVDSAMITSNGGTITGLDQSITVGGEIFTHLIMTDIAFRGGYSGGPLVDMQGDIIGVHTAYDTVGSWSTLIDEGILAALQESV